MKPLFVIVGLLAFRLDGSHPKLIGGPCEACELMFENMPAQISERTNIAKAGEEGEPLIISGIIYQPDGKTPAPGVILYVYHTDSKGFYSPAPNQKDAVQHGHLRGWVKPNEVGFYEFKTIRPASYPKSKAPQHIHPIIYEPQKGYYWIDEYVFTDDPFLTEEEKSHTRNRGGSGIIDLKKNKQGAWEGKRNIILGKNIPDYK